MNLRLLLGLLVLAAGVTAGLWTMLAFDRIRQAMPEANKPPELADIAHCLRPDYAYAQLETCIGQPANNERGGWGGNRAIIRTYRLVGDVQLVLVFTPADTLYSATATWPNGTKQNFFP